MPWRRGIPGGGVVPPSLPSATTEFHRASARRQSLVFTVLHKFTATPTYFARQPRPPAGAAAAVTSAAALTRSMRQQGQRAPQLSQLPLLQQPFLPLLSRRG